jgi:hypothetical protein
VVAHRLIFFGALMAKRGSDKDTYSEEETQRRFEALVKSAPGLPGTSR